MAELERLDEARHSERKANIHYDNTLVEYLAKNVGRDEYYAAWERKEQAFEYLKSIYIELTSLSRL